jgi:hypothetical protein
MAALNFPVSPTNGQTHTENGTTWVFNGSAWIKPDVTSHILIQAQALLASQFGAL